MKHFRNNADLLYEIKHSTPKRGNKRERERGRKTKGDALFGGKLMSLRFAESKYASLSPQRSILSPPFARKNHLQEDRFFPKNITKNRTSIRPLYEQI